MDELAARRRRVWLGLIMVVAFGLLTLAALLPSPTGSLRVEQAGADETVPANEAPTTSSTLRTMPTTRVAPSPTTTAEPTPTTTAEPTTTTTAPAAKKPASTPTTAPAAASPVPVSSPAPSVSAFLACIRMRESHNNYTTVSASGNYRGAYQFNQPAWDSTAIHAGRPDLVGKQANLVSPADQDALALDLYLWQGSRPWGGACD